MTARLRWRFDGWTMRPDRPVYFGAEIRRSPRFSCLAAGFGTLFSVPQARALLAEFEEFAKSRKEDGMEEPDWPAEEWAEALREMVRSAEPF